MRQYLTWTNKHGEDVETIRNRIRRLKRKDLLGEEPLETQEEFLKEKPDCALPEDRFIHLRADSIINKHEYFESEFARPYALKHSERGNAVEQLCEELIILCKVDRCLLTKNKDGDFRRVIDPIKTGPRLF